MSFRELELDLTQYQNKLTLIEGKVLDEDKADSNGSGKSTIVEALVYGSFGETVRGLKYVSDIVNSDIRKDCSVEVFFDDFHVVRYRDHTKYGNELFFYNKAGVDLRGKSIDDTQMNIDKSLGMDYLSFVNSHVFIGAVNNFTSATDTDRKRLVQTVVDVGWMDESLNKVKQDSGRTNELVSELNMKFVSVESLKQEVQNDIYKLQGAIEKASNEKKVWLENNERDKKRFESTLNKLKIDLDDVNKVVRRKNELSQYDVSTITEQIKKTMDNLTVCKSDIKVLDSDYKRIDKQLLKFRQLKGVCDECEQKVDKKYSEGKINQLHDELDDLLAKKNKKVLECERLEKELDSLLKEEEEIDNLKELIRGAELKVVQLEKEILSVNNNLSKLNAEEVVFGDKVSDLKERLHDKELRFTELEDELGSLKKQESVYNSRMSYLNCLEKVFGKDGLRTYVFNQIIPIFNEKINYYLSYLSDNLFVTIDTKTQLKSGKSVDKFDVSVEKIGGAKSYSGLSTGQKRRADIAIVMAFKYLYSLFGKDKDIMFMDEIFDSLDEVGIESAVNMLRKEGGTRFCITHRQDLKDYFDNVITVEMKNGVSNLIPK